MLKHVSDSGLFTSLFDPAPRSSLLPNKQFRPGAIPPLMPSMHEISQHSSGSNIGSWLTTLTPSSDQPHVRLVAFPHAGGSASTFRDWPRELPPTISLCAVQYPGRGPRHAEVACANLEQLCDSVIDALLPTLDCGLPFAFFGHSFGSIVASEVARELAARHLPVPVALLLSAHPAPGVELDVAQAALSRVVSDEVRAYDSVFGLVSWSWLRETGPGMADGCVGGWVGWDARGNELWPCERVPLAS